MEGCRELRGQRVKNEVSLSLTAPSRLVDQRHDAREGRRGNRGPAEPRDLHRTAARYRLAVAVLITLGIKAGVQSIRSEEGHVRYVANRIRGNTSSLLPGGLGVTG